MTKPDDLDWRLVLKTERGRLGLSQARLGELVRVSPETIRKYEGGTRTPSRDILLRIIDALQLPTAQGHAILEAIGYAGAPTLFPLTHYPDYYFTVKQLQTAVNDVPWPQFVANDMAEIVAANRAAEALWGIDFEAEMARRSRAHVHFLSIAGERQFSQHIVNFDECLGHLIGILKGSPRNTSSLESPGAFFMEVLGAFAANDPAAIPRLVSAWERTPPKVAKVRWSYPVIWRDATAGDIEFLALVTTASDPDGLGFNDWVPVDPESHRRLAMVVERSGQARGLGR
jgi:transcriptional regulator with XRE-family HTH domain